MEILPQLLVNALIAGSIYALASAGLSLTYGLLRILNFSHGHLLMVGAYLFYWASVEQSWSLLASGLLTATAVVLIGLIALRVFIRPFLPFSEFLPIVTTLSLATIFESCISMIFGVNVKSLTVAVDGGSLELGPIFITPIQILIIASAIILLSAVAFVIHSTSIGRKVRALLEHANAAESLGISCSVVTTVVFIVGTLLAAYAGILVGYETNLQPTMGSAYTIKAFAAMILGGLGNMWGTIAGAYILGLVENLSIGLDLGRFSLPAGYKDAFAFIIILLVLLVRPQGLLRKRQRTV